MVRISLLVALFLSISITIFAQSQANTGNIEGRVTDPNAASVPGVTVTATNLANGLQKSAQTNDEGVYRIVFLPLGAYKVETSGAQGFVPATFTNVIVTVGGQRPSISNYKSVTRRWRWSTFLPKAKWWKRPALRSRPS